jgi:hypothetical protein
LRSVRYDGGTAMRNGPIPISAQDGFWHETAVSIASTNVRS